METAVAPAADAGTEDCPWSLAPQATAAPLAASAIDELPPAETCVAANSGAGQTWDAAGARFKLGTTVRVN